MRLWGTLSLQTFMFVQFPEQTPSKSFRRTQISCTLQGESVIYC